MQGSKESEALPFSEAMVNHASVVFEVVALPPETPVIRLAQQRQNISGAEVTAQQAVNSSRCTRRAHGRGAYRRSGLMALKKHQGRSSISIDKKINGITQYRSRACQIRNTFTQVFDRYASHHMHHDDIRFVIDFHDGAYFRWWRHTGKESKLDCWCNKSVLKHICNGCWRLIKKG
jgi:shikimate dehydrogenase